MTDLRTRFRALDNLHAPDLWSEVEARAMVAEPRQVGTSRWVLIAVVALLAAAMAGAALVGSGIVKLPILVEASATPSPTPGETAVPSMTAEPTPGPSGSPSSTPDEAPTGRWSVTGNMIEARDGTATLLLDGRVLVAGGTTVAGLLTGTAELYDAESGTWTATGDMVEARAGHTATLLPDGRVLVAGGITERVGPSSAELYDPATGTWAATGSLAEFRGGHAAALLPSPDGTVLVVGGDGVPGGDSPVPLATAELFDVASGTWTAAASMAEGRIGLTATLLADGTVVAVGGYGGIPGEIAPFAELYDPDTGIWTVTGPMVQPRYNHTATLLLDESLGVLVAAGLGSGTGTLASAELYDPSTRSWSATGGMSEARQAHTASMLPDGTVLVAGGDDGTGTDGVHATAELYDPVTGTWAPTASMSAGVTSHMASQLIDGRVLVGGGYGSDGLGVTPEVYDPDGNP